MREREEAGGVQTHFLAKAGEVNCKYSKDFNRLQQVNVVLPETT